MKMRWAILLGTALLLAGCAAAPDYGYHYGYAGNDYGSYDGYGPYSYGYGPSFNLNLGFSDRDRGDSDRRADFRGREQARAAEQARAGAGGERHDPQVGRGGAPQVRHEGSDHERDHDRGDRR